MSFLTDFYKVVALTTAVVWFSVAIFASKSIMANEQTCITLSTDCSLHNRTDYVAAVVEYKPVPIANQTAVDALLSNVKFYVNIMEDASHSNVDIIVFPEYGITTIGLPGQRENARNYLVEIPPIGSNPCSGSRHLANNSEILYELSCAANMYKMYLVVNLGEVETCDQEVCPQDGFHHYNTNLVFDRNGSIIARYRKFHLYFEPQFDFPAMEYSTFKTDFGVEFGLFTCFDIIFAHPAIELSANGIQNFVFPTAWIDELPFLTAIQAQSMWAQSNKANLLASGYHQPDRGSMGSGIYSGHYQGALNYVYDANSGTKLIISSVPIYPETSQTWKADTRNHACESKEMPYFWLREDLSNCSHKTLNPTLTSESLCFENKLCCDIEYVITPDDHNNVGEMKLIAFDGRRTVAAKRDWFEWQVCAIVHCLNDTLESCTETLEYSSEKPIPPKLEKLRIHMQPLKVEYEGDRVAQPALSLLDTSFNLLPQTYFEITQSRNENGVTQVQANNKEFSNIVDVPVKTIALIQKVFNGRQ